jgi:hypothetical protein
VFSSRPSLSTPRSSIRKLRIGIGQSGCVADILTILRSVYSVLCALYCTALRSVYSVLCALCCTVLHCTLYCVLCTVCSVLHRAVLYCTVLYCTVLYCTILYSSTPYCTNHTPLTVLCYTSCTVLTVRALPRTAHFRANGGRL